MSSSAQLEEEFNRDVIDIKPYVVRLNDRQQRQRCAGWIRKLCQTPPSGRRNRNLHTKLLLFMLKRGSLDEPFTSDVIEDEPLPHLPRYMSAFLDSSSSRQSAQNGSLHEWLDEQLGSSSSRHNPSHGDDVIRSHDDSTTLVSFRDEARLSRVHEREAEMKVKLAETKFHEEKLKAEQRHDSNVQKILERKNSEIAELKRDHKRALAARDDDVAKLERKLQQASKEMQQLRESKARRLTEVQEKAEEARTVLKAEHEAKLDEMAARAEKEKYELQKIHTKNIQQLLDETNQRLAHMDDDYTAQSRQTKTVIGDLEHRVALLTSESESTLKAKEELEGTKEKLEEEIALCHSSLQAAVEKCEKLSFDLDEAERKHENMISSLTSRHQADVEYSRQQHDMTSSRHEAAMRDAEERVDRVTSSLQDLRERSSREKLELETAHRQLLDEIRRKNEAEVERLRHEMASTREELQRRLKGRDDVIEARDREIRELNMAGTQAFEKAQVAIESFKKQASDAQQEIYAEMKAQLGKVEGDLNRCRQEQEDLIRKHQCDVDVVRGKHEKDLEELRAQHERERTQMVESATRDRELLIGEHEKQLKGNETRLRASLEEQEKVIKERDRQHQEIVESFEKQLIELRQEVVSSNNLRRQQLVELGLLREEERQKMQRESDQAILRLENEIDRQRNELQSRHNAELERQGEKMKAKVDQLEADYKTQIERTHQRLNECQSKERDARDELMKGRQEMEEQSMEYATKLEAEYKRQHDENKRVIDKLQRDVDDEQRRSVQLRRQMQDTEFDMKNKISKVKLEYEQRLQGMLPKSVKLDYDETITSLKSQVRSLQKKVDLLEDSAFDNMSDLDDSNLLQESILAQQEEGNA